MSGLLNSNSTWSVLPKYSSNIGVGVSSLTLRNSNTGYYYACKLGQNMTVIDVDHLFCECQIVGVFCMNNLFLRADATNIDLNVIRLPSGSRFVLYNKTRYSQDLKLVVKFNVVVKEVRAYNV